MKAVRPVLLAIALSSVGVSPLRADGLEERWSEATRLSEAKDFEAALQTWDSIKKSLEDYLDIRKETFQIIEWEMGNCLFQLGRFSEARDAYRRCFLMTDSEEFKRDVLSALKDLDSSSANSSENTSNKQRHLTGPSPIVFERIQNSPSRDFQKANEPGE